MKRGQEAVFDAALVRREHVDAEVEFFERVKDAHRSGIGNMGQ